MMEIITAEQLMEYLGKRFICIINVLTQYPSSEGFSRKMFEELIKKKDIEMQSMVGSLTTL